MVIWTGYGIKGFALDAGFPTDHLPDAIAVAWATSEGDDKYRSSYGDPPVVDARGLWGIDLVAFPTYENRDLFDPRQNARVAYDLWLDHHRSFSWSPVWVAGIDLETYRLSGAIAMSSRRGDTVPVWQPSGEAMAGLQASLASAASFTSGLGAGPFGSE